MGSSRPFPDPDIGGQSDIRSGVSRAPFRNIGRCAAQRERRTGRYAPAPPCAPRPPSARPRSRRSPPAWRRRSSAAASSSPRPSSPRRPRPRRSRSASSSRARARVMWGRASCRCGPIWPPTRCPTTIRRRSSAGSRSPTPSTPTRGSAGARRRRCGSSARSAATAPSAGGRRLLVWSHWIWFAFPHGTVLFLLLRHRDRFPRGAAQIYATFDLGLIGYWAVPTAPPWYAAKEGLMDDGLTPELRRMMVEYGEQFWGSGWKPLYGFLGGNPLAAMPSLHFATSVTAARLLAETGRTAGVLGWGYAGTLGVALVYLGEHYVVDLARRPRARRGRAPRRAAGGAARRADVAHRAAAGGPRALMTESAAPVQQVSPEPREDDDERPALQLTRRNVIALAGFLILSLGALYFLLPQLAGLDDTWNRIGDGRPVWIIAAFAVHVRHVRRLRRDVPRRVHARGRRPDRLAGELPDHDGQPRRLAPVRRGRRRRAGADRVGAPPVRHAQAHRGRQDDGLPRADLPALRVRGDRLRLRAPLGAVQRAEPVHAHVRARRDRLHRAG